jgi:cytochrome c-type biogenesis protein CcmH
MLSIVIACAGVAVAALLFLLTAYLREKRMPMPVGDTPAAHDIPAHSVKSDSVAAMPFSGRKMSLVVAVISFLAIVTGSILYWKLGRSDTEKVPSSLFEPKQGEAPHGGLSDLDGMAERLAARLNTSGQNDGNGWVLLARTYVELKRYPEAASTFERAHKLIGDSDAQMLADYADAHTMANGRRFDAKSKDLVVRALKTDPANQKALELDASVAYDTGDYKKAAAQWAKLLPLLPAGSDHALVISANIAEARSRAGLPAGPPILLQRSAQASAGAGINGSVRLAPALQGKVAPGDTLFVFARAPGESKAPVAIVRATAAELPFAFTLDDSRSMIASARLSSMKEVNLVARVSKSGTAVAQPGDLEGSLSAVKLGASGVQLLIDRDIR